MSKPRVPRQLPIRLRAAGLCALAAGVAAFGALPAAAEDTAAYRLETWPALRSAAERRSESATVPVARTAAEEEAREILSAFSQVRASGFAGWDDSGGLRIVTRMGRFPQVHSVASPLADRRQITFFNRRIGALDANPVPSLRNFLFTQDEGGDEEYRLRLFDLAAGRSRPMPCPPGRVTQVVWDASGKSFVYAHTPAGTDRWDVRMGTPEGKDTLLFSRPGTWVPMDWWGGRLLVQRYISAAESEILSFTPDDSAPSARVLPPMRKGYLDHAVSVRIPRTGNDSNIRGRTGGDIAVVFTSDHEGESARLYRFGIPDSAPHAISPDSRYDVEWVVASPDRRSLVYSMNEEGISRLYHLVPGKKPVLLDGIPPGIIETATFRPETRPGGGTKEIAVTVNSATSPGDVYVCRLARGAKAVRWTASETGGIPPETFRSPELIRYPSDSMSVAAWLYLPAPAASAPVRRHPVLIQIHGGPEQQARPGFDSFAQYAVSNPGYAVIVPNVRGSSGYGKAWLAADDGFKRMDAVRDIGALLDWIATRPDLDAGKVAVAGRSYGGFMALASLQEHSSRIRGGISTVGITHFPTFLERTSGYRRDLRRVEYGDEREPRMRAFLDSISPLSRLDRLRSPLLLCHGRNDPRVPYAESERIFAALKKRQVPAWFLTFRDEGHAFNDPEARLVYWRTQGEFLERLMGETPWK